MADDERAVLLGTVQERQAVDDRLPTACKAGGSPAWYNSSAPPQEAASLACPRCHKALFLVAQVYAPVDVDRSLYVFGCNSVECTETPGSWRVLRDQSEVAPVATNTTASADPEELASGPEEKRSAWDAGDDSDDSDWGDDANDNGNDGATDDPFDLEKLLLQRDDAMSAATKTTFAGNKKEKQSAVSALASLDNTAAALTTPSSTNVFPPRLIEVIDEPYEDYASENDFSHENALLEDYMKQEEEEKSTDVGDLRKLLSSSKKGKRTGAAEGGGGGKVSSSGESYEKTPAQQRHFMRFQKRISRCPLQCLRYDYGGEPLWPVPKPQGIKVPKCVCGAERVFELQLTPTINYFLKVDQFASPIATPTTVPSSTPVVVSGSLNGDDNGEDDDNDDEMSGSRSAASATTKKTMAAAVGSSAATPVSAGGGMDWLSVVVYCCPKSCSQSHEEFVFVLPAEKS